ncbi:Putative polypeptide N-acetylgalactosaminyltransferase-like protein 3 [Myotis davidii]|uniref:Putative polypeptide N-acetylgalactosaminyltransferase-like protein 3 n=1 Tax=Myotis davidii TaxID=225400 RepID=L5LG00_MYODS|nr:Putative polypeptide N-acetylgalactosaminyltransferase-like protein 3 [Myotis davidii]
MASLRRVKVLLVLNLIAVAGFVLFLAKCRPIAVRSGDAFHEIRPRAEATNLSAHGASPIQDAVLKRLSLLEDIVYRQLNGQYLSLSSNTNGSPWPAPENSHLLRTVSPAASSQCGSVLQDPGDRL